MEKKRLKRVLKLIIDKIINLIARVLSLFSDRSSIYLFGGILLALNRVSNTFFTFHVRPNDSLDTNNDCIFESLDWHSDVGIVIQGPINYTNEFTFRTIELYKKNFPKISIVLSTWEDEDDEYCKKIEKLNVKVIKSRKPFIVGSHNINYQIVSTQVGINYLKTEGVKYVCKTRTDQRFYSKFLFDYFKLLLNQYKLKNCSAKGRIIELSVNILRFRPWSMCDMFQFGYIEDLSLMWNLDLDSRTQSSLQYSSKQRKIREIAEDNIGEIYIHRNYAHIIGLESNVSYLDYYNNLKFAYIVIDKEEIDIIWHKYLPMEYAWIHHPMYNSNQILSRITHAEWVKLYLTDLPNLNYLERKLDMIDDII